MNRREMLQAGLGIAAGVVAAPLATLAASQRVVKRPIWIEFVGEDGSRFRVRGFQYDGPVQWRLVDAPVPFDKNGKPLMVCSRKAIPTGMVEGPDGQLWPTYRPGPEKVNQ